jgi:hypothetical protein
MDPSRNYYIGDWVGNGKTLYHPHTLHASFKPTHRPSKYFWPYKYRNNHGADSGDNGLVNAGTAGSTREGQELSEICQEPTTSSGLIQGFESQPSSSAKSNARGNSKNNLI